MPDYRMLQTYMATIAWNYDGDYTNRWQFRVSRPPYLAEFDCGRTLFGKSGALPLCLQQFVAMYGCCLSDVHSNDISANSWRAIVDQDNKGQPQQGDQNNKPGQQGQQPGQKNPGQQTQQPSQKPGQDASKS